MTGSSRNNPVWPILFSLLLAFMVCELLLSGMISRERFGGASISETSENFGQQDFGIPLAFGQKPASTTKQQVPQKEHL